MNLKISRQSNAERIHAAPVSYSIGEAARLSGLPAKRIRHYESVGVLAAASRSHSNYRAYDADAVQNLRFIARARALGFSLGEISQLIGLWREPRRASAKVKALALRHVGDLEHRIAALEDMKTTLQRLADQCRGDQASDCPILDDLAAAQRQKRRRRD